MNSLTDRDRQELALAAVPLCRKLGGEAARACGRPHEARDFVSAAYVAVVEASRKWEPAGSGRFQTYAYRWVQNALYAARLKLDPATLIDAWEEVGGTGREPGDAAPEPLDSSPLTQLHYRLLGRLKEPTRTAVELVVFEGVPADQAALQMGRAVKDVKLMLRTAVKTARVVACEGAPADEVPLDWARRYAAPARASDNN